jgi:hypothetical protein
MLWSLPVWIATFTRKYLMPPTTCERLTEKFHALLDDCDSVADNALFEKTFDDLEMFFLIQGRTFMREILQEKLQERIEQIKNNDSLQCGDYEQGGVLGIVSADASPIESGRCVFGIGRWSQMDMEFCSCCVW